MYKRKNKLVYLGIGTILLLLLVIIGVSVYNTSPENGEKKDQDTANPAPPSLTNEDKGSKSTASLDPQTQRVRLSATNLNVMNIGNAGLLGVFWWLSSDYKKQLASHQVTNNENRFTFMLSRPHYILAGVVVTAMVGYIGYFFYQKYLVEKVPLSCSLRKDVVIFALTSFLTSGLFYLTIFQQRQQEAQRKEKHSKMQLLGKILISFIVSDVVYLLAIGVIVSFKSNRKIKLFGPGGDMMWIFSILVLTSIHTIMHLSTAYTGSAQLLWAIPACFLYVQVYWYQLLPSFGSGTIDKMIAYLFHTFHLWEGLGCVFMVYYLDFSFYRVIGAWIAWECVKYALYYSLYHLDIKKISAKADYTASFPLSFTALLEGAFMILVVAFGLCDQFWPDILAARSTKILYGASVLAIGLLIRLYSTTYKGSMAQWCPLLLYGLLSISGSVVAGYYAWNGDNEKIQTMAGGSLLVFGLYLVPKFLNRLATATLALADMPQSLKKIASAIQRFTAFWLQPNLDVVCTIIIACVFECCRYEWGNDEEQVQGTENQKLIPNTLIIAFVIYGIIQVVCYNLPRYKSKGGVLEHMVFMCAYGRIVCSLENKQAANNDGLGLPILDYIYYIMVILWVRGLLNIQALQGYRKASLPSSCSLTKEDMYAIASTWDFLCIFLYSRPGMYIAWLKNLLINLNILTLRKMLSKHANNNNNIIISWGLTIVKWIIMLSWHAEGIGLMKQRNDEFPPNFTTAKGKWDYLLVCCILAFILFVEWVALQIFKNYLVPGFVFIFKEYTFTLAKLKNTLYTGYIYVSQGFLRVLVSLKASIYKSMPSASRTNKAAEITEEQGYTLNENSKEL